MSPQKAVVESLMLRALGQEELAQQTMTPPTWAVKARTKGVIGSGTKTGAGDGGMETDAPHSTQ